jgi:lycopene cyclase domain-containing protein
MDLPAGSYLSILIISLIGLYLLDRTHNLAFTVNPRRAFLAMLPAYVLFLLWDVLGIVNGIFFRGENSLLIGLEIFPDFPIEELLFLALLCYSTLIAITWAQKALGKGKFLSRGTK